MSIYEIVEFSKDIISLSQMAISQVFLFLNQFGIIHLVRTQNFPKN